MTTIACADMGIEGCDFVASGETFEQAAEALKGHGDSTHAELLQQMKDGGLTEEMLVEKMQAVAHEA